MFKTNYNPDVLNCLANLSSDEVFTPPKLVNEMLDLLPQELFANPETKFLDPVCKTGVFLREIAKRLDKGLEHKIPDKQKRIDHILSKQLFGIAITEITSLLSRRSVYCSKKANGKYSICESFNDIDGNIRFKITNHKWKNGRCIYCGANKKNYKRSSDLETHAYEFIHTKKPEEIFKMKFDVIIGNPPYQLSDGGAKASAIPIYHNFIQQAIKLNPKYISMIIPSRWFTGGRVGGLSKFREDMLRDKRLSIIHDFTNASDCFPGVEIKGGVNYFLWDRDSNSDVCHIFLHEGDKIVSDSLRPLLEEGLDTFIRYNNAIPILKKVRAMNEISFSTLVSSNDPFGFDVREENSQKRIKPEFKRVQFQNSIPFYYNGWKKKGLGYINEDQIRKNKDWIFENKIFVPKAIGSGDSKKDKIKIVIPETPSCSSETYIVIGPFKTKSTICNVASYISTKFFHFMVTMKKNTQEARKNVYELVPIQDFSETWSDDKLYKKYGLNEEEISYIESMVHPMENSDD